MILNCNNISKYFFFLSHQINAALVSIIRAFFQKHTDPRHLINSVYCEYNKRSDVFLSEVEVIGSKLLHVSHESVYTSLL